MLPVSGTFTILELPLVEETISDSTPVVLGWHRHELGNQAVPDFFYVCCFFGPPPPPLFGGRLLFTPRYN